ncbi:taste 2 receptor member 8 [Xenopus tropicalis]|uniref:Taste receptor type 2 n=1 Tax=Xenopus tropicalis TaxID=8364 RepID=Q2AB52_XENTR|nr:taste 2 receptor member 8 [Xenopus tropicalis]BAE80415.1 bitter taste receptor [Xenopus tropicalis]|eukprot:NP_001165490.1 bitter taste receptor 33 [Xenopus tropicalis]
MDLSSKVTLVYSFFAPILAVTAGAFTNAYITFVILLDYFKTKMMSSSNKILLALSLSNGYFSFLLFVCSIISFVWPHIATNNYIKGCILALLIFGISSTAWITTCLCVFYFVKIINFSSGLFAWFKLKIDIIVPWLILVSEVVSLGCSFLTLLPSVNIQEPSSNSSMFYSLNSTSGATGISADFIKVTFIAVCVPLLIMIVTTFPTIRTLYLHSRRMKNTGTSSSLAPHQSAVFMMAWLLFLYTVFFVVLFTGFIQSFTPPSFAYWMTYNLIYVATLVQSVVQILGNPKLKEAITICCCFVCHKSW